MADDDEELRKPRKKKGFQRILKESPFPIPIESLTGKPASEKRWYYYFGKLQGDKVVVDRLGDMTFLYKMGFFGKGSLSTTNPQLSKFGNAFDERRKQKIFNRGSKKSTEDKKTERESASDSLQLERSRQHRLWPEPILVADNELNCNLLQEDEKVSTENQEEVPCKQAKLEDEEPDESSTEFLQLTLEEAFFLKFGLGCLTILDDNEVSLSITELWNRCRKLKSRFVETYTVYHYFRSKGWVVRDGITFGSDYVLYKDGMPFYHSSYAVFSYMVENGEIGKTEDSLPWSWSYLTCINRVAEHVAKEVLVCLVSKPDDFHESELNSPQCLSKLEVQEILLRRWVPEKHREAKKEMK